MSANDLGRKVPVLPTIVVVAAAATCIWFGIWQLGRAQERDANQQLMLERTGLPMVSLQDGLPTQIETLYFRRVMAICGRVIDWESSSGTSQVQGAGWRYVATCLAPGDENPFKVDVGVSNRADITPDWNGGEVIGRGRSLPDTRPISQRLFGEPQTSGLMIVAETPAANLSASRQPDPTEEKNTSWSYAGQWFFFALTALVIYGLALRKRWREKV